GTADRNRSHWSTSKTPSYTKSVSWQHHQEALCIPVGEIETFGELLNSNPNAKLTFWKFWFLGSIPWERKTVTPASLWHHPGLVLIHAEGVETPQPELTEAV
ncbi:YiiX/YebB-like N1pC/P60 family cysteine hydrolase, partial [Escherichia coli]|nr:YiiX/YebB-like N1pC/P60 family cysteine hydrolase [Escherichia coli]